MVYFQLLLSISSCTYSAGVTQSQWMSHMFVCSVSQLRIGVVVAFVPPTPVWVLLLRGCEGGADPRLRGSLPSGISRKSPVKGDLQVFSFSSWITVLVASSGRGEGPWSSSEKCGGFPEQTELVCAFPRRSPPSPRRATRLPDVRTLPRPVSQDQETWFIHTVSGTQTRFLIVTCSKLPQPSNRRMDFTFWCFSHHQFKLHS